MYKNMDKLEKKAKNKLLSHVMLTYFMSQANFLFEHIKHGCYVFFLVDIQREFSLKRVCKESLKEGWLNPKREA